MATTSTEMENYIVSARKYRPSTFDSVVGQQALTTTLKNAIAQGKLAHAYLFCGPRGVGKTTCARIFAKTINCLNPTPQGEACNECESCRAFDEQRSYNIHELDAASNNSVEDIRELIAQVQLPPQVGRYKVFIIDEVHMLSAAAFNAFLKTLEEPPAHAIFILATTEKHKILPTILSRCQIYDFNRITVADAVKHLQYVAEKEGITYEPEALHVIAEKADGGMRDALSIFDQVTSFCEGNITYEKVIEDLNVLDYDAYFDMTDALLKGDVPAAMLRFNNILNKGFEANYFIGGLASHFRNLLMGRDEQTLPLLDVSGRVRQRYKEQAQQCPPKFLYRALKLCNDCDINYRTSRNKRLLVEITLIQVAQASQGEEDTPGCGRSPIRRLNPIFNPQAASASGPATAPAQPTGDTGSNAPSPEPAAATGSKQASLPATAAQVRPEVPKQERQRTAPVNKPPQTLSIRTLRSQYQTEHETDSSIVADSALPTTEKPTPQSPQHNVLSYPFTQDQLVYHWFRFAQQLPQEKSAIAGRMRNMNPKLKSDWTIEITVPNEMVEQYLRDIQVSIRNYLRTQLRNDLINLQIQVDQNSEEHKAFSRVEQLQDMLKRSPELEFLRKELGLELA